MEEDDDFVLVIIGDEETVTDSYASSSIHIKTELIPPDEICPKILEHGEVIQSEDLLLNVKEEMEDYDDGYNDNKELQNHNDNYSDYDSITNAEQNVLEFSDHGFDDNIEYKRSIVQMLRDRYPDWGKDELVVAVMALMQNIKPPPLPEVHYTESGGFYKCVVCKKKLKTVVAAGRHYEEKHGPRYRKCFGCLARFTRRTNLYKHERFSCSSPDKAIVLKARKLFLARGSKERRDKGLRNENKRYACAECPADFTSKMHLRAHENLHAGVRPHVCRLCPAAYTSASSLWSHMVKHSNIQFICDHCGRSFERKDCLITHLNTHLPQKKYGCVECSRRYESKRALQMHVRRVHRGLPPTCACCVCGLRFNKMSILKEHMKSKHNMDLVTRNSHMVKHSNIQFICDHCGRSFKKKDCLITHLNTHRRKSPQKKYGCEECSKRYASKYTLKLHVHRVHRGLPPPRACCVCGLRFNKMSILKEHMKSKHNMDLVTRNSHMVKHSNIPFICYHCGRSFKQKDCMITHLNTHLPQKKYGCEECSKRYGSKYTLQLHVDRVHRGLPPPRTCCVCGLRFNKMSVLKEHMKSKHNMDLISRNSHMVKHSNRQFICDHCGRSFKKKYRLITHLNTHLPQKKYGCEECSKRYASKYTLQLHVDLVHRGLPPPCACCVCGSRFNNMWILKEHMISKHNMDLVTRNQSHMVKHSNIQFICDHCGRSFKKKRCLITHLNTHLPQKKYGCEECSKRYTSNYALQLHVYRVHRGMPPPCTCRVCGSRFNRMSILKEHMKSKHHMDSITRNMLMKTLPSVAEAMAQAVRQHERLPDPPPALEQASSERAAGAAEQGPRARLQCAWCDKTYAYRQDLRRHERAHAAPPSKPQCDVCKQHYSRIKGLKKHMESVHGMLMMSRKKFLKSLPRLVEIKAEIVHQGQAVPAPAPPGAADS